MRGSDGNTQQRAIYIAEYYYNVRYQWPLFQFLINIAIVNTFILYQLEYPDKYKRLNYQQFRRYIGLTLLRNPIGQRRKRPYEFSYNNSSIPGPKHNQKRVVVGPAQQHRGSASSASRSGRQMAMLVSDGGLQRAIEGVVILIRSANDAVKHRNAVSGGQYRADYIDIN